MPIVSLKNIWPQSISLGKKLAEAEFRPSGFDYMRLSLAIAVVCEHSVDISYGWDYAINTLWQGPLRPFLKVLMPMFFVLSGFTLVTFLGLRVLRIYPALIVEILLSAILIGPVATTLPLSQYFSGSDFFYYLLNVTGHPHYYLPGVFEDNPLPGKVNEQLWTIPFELYCYISFAGLFLLGIKTKRIMAPAAAVFGFASLLIFHLVRHHGFFERAAASNGYILVVCFLAGVSGYLYRENIPWSKRFFVVAALAVYGLGFLQGGDFFVIFPAAYVTIFIGLSNPKRRGVLKGADLSYGIYLYGLAIQQMVVFLLPGYRQWYSPPAAINDSRWRARH